MSNLTRHFVTVCVAIAAACMALALFAAAEFPAILAGLSGLGAFLFVMLMRGLAEAKRRHQALADDVADDRSVIDALIGRADAIEARLKAAEMRLARSATEDMAVEIATLGALVKDLADNISSQEAGMASLVAAAKAAAASGRAFPPGSPAAASAPPGEPRRHEPPARAAAGTAAPRQELPRQELPRQELPRQEAPRQEAPRSAAPRQDATLPLPPEIAEALAARRVDMHMQPIVTLPQRKIRAYQALALLRTEDGRTIPEGELERFAASGRLAVMDEVLLLGAVQVVRRLAQKNKELTLICTLSRGAAHSTSLLDQAIELFSAGGEGLASHLVLEIPQPDFASVAQASADRLKRLAATGCRFALGPVADLRLDPAALAARAVRFVKIPARTLLEDASGATEIHAADLAGLLSRYGVELVAEGVDTEGLVADLLDFDLRLARGDLFSPSRPVRADVMAREARPPARPSAAPSAAPAAAKPPARAEPVTLGQGALQGAIERLRKVQEERAAAPPAPSPGPEVRRPSAWRTLARRVGAPDKSG
jgi:cyclic-di-GMP phosphodiesterase TipF (flagellum assembly factor)